MKDFRTIRKFCKTTVLYVFLPISISPLNIYRNKYITRNKYYYYYFYYYYYYLT
jgi:hypothetical protein